VQTHPRAFGDRGHRAEHRPPIEDQRGRVRSQRDEVIERPDVVEACRFRPTPHIDLHVDGMHLLGKLQAVAKRIWYGRHPAANLAIPGGACRWPDARADRNPSQSLRRAATARKGFAPKPAARPANPRARKQDGCPSRRSGRSSHLPESRLGIPEERSFPAERPSPGSGQAGVRDTRVRGRSAPHLQKVVSMKSVNGSDAVAAWNFWKYAWA